jgi:hypothetical protein
MERKGHLSVMMLKIKPAFAQSLNMPLVKFLIVLFCPSPSEKGIMSNLNSWGGLVKLHISASYVTSIIFINKNINV